jgi:hypothetical protein
MLTPGKRRQRAMIDNTTGRTFPADQDGIKLAAILDRYHKGSRAGSARKMHALDGISWIVKNAIRGSVELVEI